MIRRPPRSTPLSLHDALPISAASAVAGYGRADAQPQGLAGGAGRRGDRKSTRLNSSHVRISYAVFCLKKKKKKNTLTPQNLVFENTILRDVSSAPFGA